MSKGNFSLNNVKFLHKILGTDPKKPDEMQPSEVLSYSLAGFGQNMICQLVTSFFLFFLTDAVGLNPIWLAFMFLGARLFDAFNDPIMGSIVDRTRSKYGKMRPYLKYMPIPICIFTVLMFVNLGASQVWAFVYATVIYLAWGICYTTVDVPYWGLATSMTSDTDKRNSMLTVARLLCMGGAGIVTVVIPAIQGVIRDGYCLRAAVGHEGCKIGNILQHNFEGINQSALQADYKWLFLICSIVVVVLALPTFYIGFRNTKERFYEDSKRTTLKQNIKLLFKNNQLMLIIGMGVLGCLRLVYMTSGLYYAKYNLGNEAIFSTLTLLVIPGGLLATLTTPYLSRKIGKKNLFIFSHLLGGVAMMLLYFIGLPSNGTNQMSIIFFYIVLIILGLPSGYSNILSYSMIADTIDYLEDKTGERAEGICFSMQTFISKIGMAFTAFVVLMVLGVEGYADADKLTGANAPLSGIWMMTTLLSGLSTILCVIPLFFYTFTEKKQKEAVGRVSERKAAALALAGGGEMPMEESFAEGEAKNTSAPFSDGTNIVAIEEIAKKIEDEELVEKKVLDKSKKLSDKNDAKIDKTVEKEKATPTKKETGQKTDSYSKREEDSKNTENKSGDKKPAKESSVSKNSSQKNDKGGKKA